MKEEEKQTKKPVPMRGKKTMKKRWVYPAVYLSFAAVILTSVLWYQNDAKNETENTPKSAFEDDGTAVPVSLSKEVFQMPVADPEAVEVVKDFFSQDSTAEEQEAALVFYNNIYYQNRGVDLGAEGGKAFDVTAALSGNVVKVAKDPALGWVVEVEHDKGVVTHYSSLASASVKEGDQVKQGTVLGKAGENAYDKDAKIHAHFEVRKDGVAVDPVMAWDQSVAQLASDVDSHRKEMKKQEEKKAEEQKPAPAEEKKPAAPKAEDKGGKGTKDEGKGGKDGKDANREQESSTESSEDSDAPSETNETSTDDSGANE